MQATSPRAFEFGDFRLDPAKRLLRRRDRDVVPLTPRVFDTLLFLIENPDTVLDKERIMEAVWPDSIVEENNLTQNISTLRRVFGETPGSHSYIVTVPGRGYRFVAEVKQCEPTLVEPGPNGTAIAHAQAELTPPAREATAQRVDSSVPPARSSVRGIALVAALVVIAGAALFWWRQSGLTVDSSSLVSGYDKSVAVLPFDNLTDEKQNAYFAAGVQDEILSNLARIADLKVISRTSANLYKDQHPRNAREIGRQLGVAHVVEGSVQRAGDRLRVHAQLIDARSDVHVWAQTYDRAVSDLFTVQSEIAQSIATQLQAKISPREKAAIEQPPTRDLLAGDLYFRAITVNSERFSIEGLSNAIGFLEQAIARDPRFVQAYCALARAHVDLYSNGYDHTPSRLDLVNEIIEKAAALQPDAGEVHLVRAHYLARGRRDYDRARAELELARRVLPNNPNVYFEIALTDRRQGRWSEAIANFQRTIELDPLNTRYLVEAGYTYHTIRRYADATQLGRRALALAPHFSDARLLLAQRPFSERADIKPFRAELEAVIAANPGEVRDHASELFYCALCERDPGGLQRALALIPPDGVMAVADAVWPREWYVAVAARASGQPETARAAFLATHAILDKIVREQPGYPFAWSLLGRVDAALGNKEDAIKAGQRACELLPLSREPTSGLRPLHDLARIYAAVGENDRALDILRSYAQDNIFTDYGQLKLEPDWDPLRGDPRFEKILAALAPKS